MTFADKKHIELGSDADKMPVFHPGDTVRCMSVRTAIKCGTIVTVKEAAPAYGSGYRHPALKVIPLVTFLSQTYCNFFMSQIYCNQVLQEI